METIINNIVFEWDDEKKIKSTFANIKWISAMQRKFFSMKIALKDLMNSILMTKTVSKLLVRLKRFYSSFILNDWKK